MGKSHFKAVVHKYYDTKAMPGRGGLRGFEWQVINHRKIHF
jgi:hypothetical protein